MPGLLLKAAHQYKPIVAKYPKPRQRTCRVLSGLRHFLILRGLCCPFGISLRASRGYISCRVRPRAIAPTAPGDYALLLSSEMEGGRVSRKTRFQHKWELPLSAASSVTSTPVNRAKGVEPQ